MHEENNIIIYSGADKKIHLEVTLKDESIWLNLNQLAELFGRDKSVISRHLSSVFKEKELTKYSVVAKIATTAADGKTYQVEYYSLDAIISVGYRVNSIRATQFRKDFVGRAGSLEAMVRSRGNHQTFLTIFGMQTRLFVGRFFNVFSARGIIRSFHKSLSFIKSMAFHCRACAFIAGTQIARHYNACRHFITASACVKKQIIFTVPAP